MERARPVSDVNHKPPTKEVGMDEIQELRLMLKHYLSARCGGGTVILQCHPGNGKEVCVIRKKDHAKFEEFSAAIKNACDEKVKITKTDFSIRLEADHIQSFGFLKRI